MDFLGATPPPPPNAPELPPFGLLLVLFLFCEERKREREQNCNEFKYNLFRCFMQFGELFWNLEKRIHTHRHKSRAQTLLAHMLSLSLSLSVTLNIKSDILYYATHPPTQSVPHILATIICLHSP